MEGWKLVLRNQYPLWAVVGGFAAVAVVLGWFYLSGAESLSRRRRWILTALHVLAAGVVCAMFLQPVIISASAVREREVFAVLVDESGSMALPQGEDGTRMDTVNEVSATALPRLGELFDLRVFAFSGDVHRSESLENFSVGEEGNSTNILAALREAAGLDPAAILLMSDGCWNVGGDPRRSALSLAGRGIAVHTLAAEKGRHPDDISVRDIRCRETVFLGDSLSIQLKVIQSGFGGREVSVIVEENGTEVVTRKVVLGAPLLEQQVTLVLVPEVPGRHNYSVGVPLQDGEAADGNNRVSFTVEVAEKGVRVLLVESVPRWEFRFLRNALERDPSTSIDCLLLRPGLGPARGGGYIEHFPEGKNELGKYDVVILGDVDVRDLGSAASDLAEFVRVKGAGLVVIPGRKNGLAGYRNTPLEKMLPVEISGTTLEAGIVSHRPFPLRLTITGEEHLLTRLDVDAAESARVWETLSGGLWCAASGGARRGAAVLVEHPYLKGDRGALPLLAVQQAGNGKIVYVGWDGSWRWRHGLGDKYHYRFWAQMVRWIVKKHFEGDDPFVKLSTDRSVCNAGEEIAVEAHVLDRDFYPLEDAEVQLVLSRLDGKERERIRLSSDKTGWGIYRGTVRLTDAGDYKIGVVVPYHGSELRKTTMDIRVENPALEARSLLPNASFLENIAAITGGRCVAKDEFPAFLDELEERTRSRVRIAEYALWNSPYLFALAAFILLVEWIVRKRWGLS